MVRYRRKDKQTDMTSTLTFFSVRADGLPRARRRIYSDICRRDTDSTESWE